MVRALETGAISAEGCFNLGPAMRARIVQNMNLTGHIAGHKYRHLSKNHCLEVPRFGDFAFVGNGMPFGSQEDPRTLEFNCRMGDPETQPIMARLKSDLAELFELAIDGHLDRAEVTWDRRTALGVVLAAHGYPEAPRAGDAIDGLDPDGNRLMAVQIL